ncbi:hypothetical protein ZWY2020_011304 [Hordeum vulgare]|nr:hypothetical protein ZWY2020_011304 [Hordeum vulgare]
MEDPSSDSGQSANGAEPELDPMELYDNEESRSHTVDDSNGQSSMDVDRKQLSVDADMNGKPSLDGDGKGKYSESHAEVPIDMSLGSLERFCKEASRSFFDESPTSSLPPPLLPRTCHAQIGPGRAHRAAAVVARAPPGAGSPAAIATPVPTSSGIEPATSQQRSRALTRAGQIRLPAAPPEPSFQEPAVASVPPAASSPEQRSAPPPVQFGPRKSLVPPDPVPPRRSRLFPCPRPLAPPQPAAPHPDRIGTRELTTRRSPPDPPASSGQLGPHRPGPIPLRPCGPRPGLPGRPTGPSASPVASSRSLLTRLVRAGPR